MPIGAAESDGTSYLPHSRAAGDRAVRVLVVDDHPAVRVGLEQLLDDQPGFIVVASTSTAETAVSAAEHLRVDLAVVDYHLGGRNGLWVSRKLKQMERVPRVLTFSTFAKDHLAASCAVTLEVHASTRPEAHATGRARSSEHSEHHGTASRLFARRCPQLRRRAQ